MSQYLEFKLADFINSLAGTHYKENPVELAKTLENLANLAWDDVDELYECYQPSIRIDP